MIYRVLRLRIPPLQEKTAGLKGGREVDLLSFLPSVKHGRKQLLTPLCWLSDTVRRGHGLRVLAPILQWRNILLGGERE